MATRTNGKAKNHDWALFFCGILVILMGIVVMAWPGLSLITLAIMAGIMFLVAGIGGCVGYSRLKGMPRSGWMLANAICDILLGALFVIFPVATASMLPWLAGIWVICYGVYAIIASIGIRGTFSSWGWLLVTGIIAIICGIMFIVSPAYFVIFLGIFLIMRGATMTIDGIFAPDSLA